ncbi:hypothetical protein [Williamsia muralis]|nr:hypothetical protein [Williamsia muralis]
MDHLPKVATDAIQAALHMVRWELELVEVNDQPESATAIVPTQD